MKKQIHTVSMIQKPNFPLNSLDKAPFGTTYLLGSKSSNLIVYIPSVPSLLLVHFKS